jgi:hypothetical protein
MTAKTNVAADLQIKPFRALWPVIFYLATKIMLDSSYILLLYTNL